MVVTHSGILVKKGAVYTAWRDRWFELEGTQLAYYKNQSKKEHTGTIDITGAKVEKICVVMGKTKHFGFTLEGPKCTRKYELLSKENSEANVDEWMRKIAQALAEQQQQQQQSESERNNNAASASAAGTSTTTTSPAAKAERERTPSAIFRAEGSRKVSLQDFDLIAVIGRGSFGKVMKVRHKTTREILAMKVLKKDAIIKDNMVTHTMSEKNILQKVQHPFIVSLRYAFQTPDKLYLLLDFLSGGELFFHLSNAPERRFTEDRARFYAAQIALAIDFLHSNNVIYRDLKPENVVLDDQGNACITDFGLAKTDVHSNNATNTFCGTPEYMAPEVINGKGHGKAVDWWSLGILIYEMLAGVPPFYHENTNQMYANILRSPVSFPPHMSPEARSVINAFLDKDPNRRLGSTDFGAVKRHPFFASIDFDKLYAKQYTPPYKPPQARNDDDTSNFDTIFTSEKIKDTVALVPEAGAAAGFQGFTYTGSDSSVLLNTRK